MDFLLFWFIAFSCFVLFWHFNDEDTIEAWIVYVPAEMDGKKIDTLHHESWDALVTLEVGGLTIHKKARGKWFDKTKTITEEMIPVEIAGTRAQIDSIIKFTAKHYNQQAVMAKKISEEVIIYNRES